jgi:hypothetical protein
VGQRSMYNCPQNFLKIFFPRLWNGSEPGTMLGN